mmetsp:Transcript_12698/g.36530  ORF Transcript_12698/g.36530 Transcript_12698/m.36530 type:complete len:249 (+) Transcript_12698:292-1038(+)
MTFPPRHGSRRGGGAPAAQLAFLATWRLRRGEASLRDRSQGGGRGRRCRRRRRRGPAAGAIGNVCGCAGEGGLRGAGRQRIRAAVGLRYNTTRLRDLRFRRHAERHPGSVPLAPAEDRSCLRGPPEPGVLSQVPSSLPNASMSHVLLKPHGLQRPSRSDDPNPLLVRCVAQTPLHLSNLLVSDNTVEDTEIDLLAEGAGPESRLIHRLQPDDVQCAVLRQAVRQLDVGVRVQSLPHLPIREQCPPVWS